MQKKKKTIFNLALDRIKGIEVIMDKKFIPQPENFNERFEDIIGVTLYEDKKPEKIIFWVSDISKFYVESKPLHESQIHIKNETEVIEYRKDNSYLDGGAFFSLYCIENYELIRELSSFGGELIVVYPNTIRRKIKERLIKMIERYDYLRI